jgi:hypothetical protein
MCTLPQCPAVSTISTFIYSCKRRESATKLTMTSSHTQDCGFAWFYLSCRLHSLVTEISVTSARVVPSLAMEASCRHSPSLLLGRFSSISGLGCKTITPHICNTTITVQDHSHSSFPCIVPSLPSNDASSLQVFLQETSKHLAACLAGHSGTGILRGHLQKHTLVPPQLCQIYMPVQHERLYSRAQVYPACC